MTFAKERCQLNLSSEASQLTLSSTNWSKTNSPPPHKASEVERLRGCKMSLGGSLWPSRTPARSRGRQIAVRGRVATPPSEQRLFLVSGQGGGRAIGSTQLRAPRPRPVSRRNPRGPGGKPGRSRLRIRSEPPRCTHAGDEIKIRTLTELPAFTRNCASEASAARLM